MSREILVRRSNRVITTPSTFSAGLAARGCVLGLEQIVGAFHGEVGGLNGHEQMRGRDQGIDGQDAERRGRIDQDVVVVL